MFCTSCGNSVSEVKGGFCPGCGTKVAELAPKEFAPAQVSSVSECVNGATKRKAKAFTAVLAGLLILTMSCGWAVVPSFNFGYSDRRDAGVDFNTDGLSLWNNFNEIIVDNRIIQFTLERDATRGRNPSEWQIVSADILSSFSRGATISRILVAAGTLGLLMFLCFVQSGDKRAWRIGQLSFLTAAVASIIFIVSAPSAANAEEFFRGAFSPSIWAYLTFAIGVIGLIFISMKMKKISE
ncbi:MAG: hypothetical protein FWB96_05155 [Defluviitaleaceae bacterium]|nr:hypothetical protein [Defluviitaleaceae bacterium]MCL2262178.1 hypothetical protein [Defluviitaleaceae bacterium]